MAVWIYRRDPSSKLLASYTDQELMRFVRMGTASGMELVKLDERSSDWVPLYTLPWFRELVKAAPDADLELIAMRRRSKKWRVLGGVLGGYMSLAFMGGLLSGLPAAQRPAGAAISLGIAAAVGGIIAYRTRVKRKAVIKQTPHIEAHDALSDAIAALEQDLAQASSAVRATADVTTIRNVVANLRAQGSQLEALAGRESRDALLKELQVCQARAAAAEGADPSLRDALADEVRAIEGRIRSLERAEAARIENAARLRAMLHEVHGLRLALGRTRVDVSLEDQTIERLRELKRQLEAETRIADDLDAALRADTEHDEIMKKQRATTRAIGP